MRPAVARSPPTALPDRSGCDRFPAPAALTRTSGGYAGNLIAFEIIGGVVDDDKKSKVTTVVFEDEDCVHLETGKSIDTVSFTLVRTPLRD